MTTLILDPSVAVTVDASGNQLVHCVPQPATNVGTSFIADVVNHSKKLTTAQMTTICAAVKKQLDRDISKYWGQTASFNFGAPIPGNVKFGFFDTSDQPGALGWHDDQNNVVTIECFYIGTLSDLGVTVSHEMAETVGDYNANTTVKGVDPNGKPCLFFTENCDPTESDTYQIDGVDVSNFATPAWFQLPSVSTDKRFDALQLCTKPFEIRPGGYMEISYDNGATWTQIQERTSGFQKFSNSRSNLRNIKKSHGVYKQ